jgi:hypothetical protein
MIYIFHRAEGFYPLTLGGDEEAIANANCNAGTIKVTDTENRVVFPVGEKSDAQKLQDAYREGWHACARWAKRDDLHCDVGSPKYLKEMAEALSMPSPRPDAGQLSATGRGV